MKEQVLVRFKKKSYDQIVKEANKRGLGKAGLVRMIVLKELSREI